MMTAENKPLLYDLWKKSCSSVSLSSNENGHQDSEDSWEQNIKVLYQLGIGMEETIRFLYLNQPTYAEFESWLNQTKNVSSSAGSSEIDENQNDVLTEADLKFWDENGYLVLRNVISRQQCIATQNAICAFLNMQAENSLTWYQSHEDKKGLMVSLVHHPTLDANRESAIIRKAYQQLYRSTEIYKTIDKVSFNPPVSEHACFMGSQLHWDVSLSLPIPFALQGLLYLTDCESHEGAFHCVPGFHHQIEAWLNQLPAEVNPREEALRKLKSVAVVGQAGDFVIWHQALPHCATPNLGKNPRMVQYLTYLPMKEEIQEVWK
ncbi:MAG: phytanoyl-CoA dioxygenase family protein [Undibacterium sp.]|nr:phytanoyl-CoA dioxygenase family protein [Undibacterium sp.]